MEDNNTHIQLRETLDKLKENLNVIEKEIIVKK